MTRKGRGAAKRVEAVAPTTEQQQRAGYELGDVIDRDGAKALRVGKAYRKIRMVETLAKKGAITEEEAKALRHYRHHADMADRSPVRDSLAIQRFGGSGHGPTVEMINAVRVVQACEAAAGSVRDILRAVVVDDSSLSEWAISQSGSIDDCRTAKGKRVCSIRPHAAALQIAQLDIRVAAQRVQAELDA